ncbi:Reverse transcriptase (RNA-dependent DNA polymerase) [Fragilaria crotonensis]|nr:Reverse transcriptase (RNA-dependent DNA polymerase) [Fragilaria crotonensis]
MQLYDREVIRPRGKDEMTDEEREAALQYLMFLKQKRDGTVKGRGCADGRKQRSYTTKEEASSPTVATESVMLSCTIDAEEERDVGVVDLPAAFMQVGMEGERTVHMKLEGKMAELMVGSIPKCIESTFRWKTDGWCSMWSWRRHYTAHGRISVLEEAEQAAG